MKDVIIPWLNHMDSDKDGNVFQPTDSNGVLRVNFAEKWLHSLHDFANKHLTVGSPLLKRIFHWVTFPLHNFPTNLDEKDRQDFEIQLGI